MSSPSNSTTTAATTNNNNVDAAVTTVADVFLEQAVATAVEPTLQQLRDIETSQGHLSSSLEQHYNATMTVHDHMKYELEPTFAKLPEYTAKIKKLKKQMDSIEESVKSVHSSMISVAKDVRAHAATMDQVHVGDAIKNL